MQERLEILRQKNPGATLRMQWMPYERISPHLKRAIIAAEDSKFLEHEGFDFEAIQKAYEKNLKKGRLVAGGSTISQQLAKNLFLSGRKNSLAQRPGGRHHIDAGKRDVQTPHHGNLPEYD